VSYVYHHVDIVRVIDGDSVVLDVDMGNKMRWQDNFRLMGIDAPERGQDGHREATVHLIDLLGTTLSHIETHKADKFGRWLVTLYVPGQHCGEINVNERMVSDGHAKPYFGGRK